MIQTTWSIENNNVIRIPAERLTAERRNSIASKVSNKYPVLKTCILCDECFQGEVVEKGRKCAKCVVILSRRQELEMRAEQTEMCLRILLYGLIVGGVLIWISSMIVKN